MELPILKMSWANFWSPSLVFLFLLFAVLKTSVADIAFILMFLTGLFCLYSSIKSADSDYLSKYEQALLYLFAIYSLVSILVYLGFDSGDDARHRLEDDVKLLLLIPFYLVIRRIRVQSHVLVYMVACVCFILGLSSIAQYFSFNPVYPHSIRPSADVNPMRYAVITLILAASLVGYVLLKKYEIMHILITFAISLGMVACILTQTRGVWIAIPILIAFGLWAYLKFGHRKLVIGLFITSVILLFNLSQLDFIKKRIVTTSTNVERYMSGDSQSSLGTRLDMYKVSWLHFKENPIFGSGLHSYKNKTHQLWKDGELEGLASALSYRRTPHNEFIMAAVEKGIIGIILVFGLFAVPFVIFYRALMYGASGESQWYGACGTIMIIVLFVAGQTGTIFNHNVFTHFYIIWIFLCVSQIRQLSPELMNWKLPEGIKAKKAV